ncbi:MAG: hypothetical protein U0V75_01180 [Ferruginibacter sp.]
MLDNLFDMIKGVAGDAVINNPDVPNEHNDAVVAEATNTVAGGLQNLVAGGGLESVLSLFGGGGQQGQQNLNGNPVVSMMIGHFAKKLMGNFGLNSNQASGVAQNLIPSVISNLVNKTNDPSNSSFTLDNLLNSLTGGQSQQVAQEQQAGGGFSFQNLIGQFTGGGQQGGGGLMDIVSKLAGGATQAQQQQGSGGLMDLIKGFIK